MERKKHEKLGKLEQRKLKKLWTLWTMEENKATKKKIQTIIKMVNRTRSELDEQWFKDCPKEPLTNNPYYK